MQERVRPTKVWMAAEEEDMANKMNVLTIEGQQFVVVSDGEACTEAYRNATQRIVHILKEPTDPSGLGKQLLDNIRADGTVKERLWKVTARRSYALQHNLPPWPSLDPTEFGEALRASAIVNLNDTFPCGQLSRSRSRYPELLRMAKQRWEHRKAELDGLGPSIVVCGGTYDITVRLLAESGETVSDEGDLFFRRGVPFVRAAHPSFSHKKHSVEYEDFQKVCRMALERHGILGRP